MPDHLHRDHLVHDMTLAIGTAIVVAAAVLLGIQIIEWIRGAL